MNRRLFFRFLAAAPAAIVAAPLLASMPAKRGMTIGELRRAAEWGHEAYVPLKDTGLSKGIMSGRRSAERFNLMVDEYRIEYGETDSLAARLFPHKWNGV